MELSKEKFVDIVELEYEERREIVVLFPAPLGPMIPNASPGGTSKLTSLSAQIS